MIAERSGVDRVPYAEITVGLPAQRFGINCAVTVEETLPVVNEFAIRMIQTCGALSPTHLQGFFGFSDREIEVVVRGLQEEKLVRWEEENLALTSYALTKFLESPDGVPRCVRLKEWNGDARFDLISYSLLDGRVVPTNLRAVVEVVGCDPDRDSRTAYWAERSFQDHFHDLVPQQTRMQIYKISEIEPKERFLAPLSCTFQVSLDGSPEVHRSLPDKNLEDDPLIAQAISDVLSKCQRRSNQGLVEVLRYFGVWDKSAFAQDGGLNFARYLDLVHIVKGNPFGHNVTPMTGALYLPGNRRELKDKLSLITELYSSSPGRRTVYWLAPDVPLWGRSLSTRSFVGELRRFAKGGPNAPAPSIDVEEPSERPAVRTFVQPGRIQERAAVRAYSDAVPDGVGLSRSIMDGNVEVLWIPGELVCVLYHYQTEHAIPVPIGFYSTDTELIERARTLFVDEVVNQKDIYELKNADTGRRTYLNAEMALRREELIGVCNVTTDVNLSTAGPESGNDADSF